MLKFHAWSVLHKERVSNIVKFANYHKTYGNYWGNAQIRERPGRAFTNDFRRLLGGKQTNLMHWVVSLMLPYSLNVYRLHVR
jgi:hypothetical protein